MTETKSLCDAREKELREACKRRMMGLALIAKRLRESENGEDYADAAFILGAVNDISDYVGLLRGIE